MGWGKFFTCGRNATMTAGVRFGGAASADPARVGHPTLGDDVVMLDGAKAMGPVTIGNRAIVAANTLVLKDVPAEAIMVGTPARIAKMRSDRPRPSDRPADAHAEAAHAEPSRADHRTAGERADAGPERLIQIAAGFLLLGVRRLRSSRPPDGPGRGGATDRAPRSGPLPKSRMAFDSDRTGNFELFAMSTDGTGSSS